MCERCNANDGRRTKTYKIEKGEALVSRVLCDGCARLINETYPVRGVPAAPKPKPEPAPEAEPEAAPEAPAVEGEEAGDGDAPAEEPEPEAAETRSPRKRARG